MTTPASQSQDPDIVSRSNLMEVDAWTGDRMKKQSEVRGFTIMCDERDPMETTPRRRPWPISPRLYCFEK